MEHLIETILPFLIHIFEIMGIFILGVAGFKAFFAYLKPSRMSNPHEMKYQFAASMATALEFKLGAEILKTVLIKSFDEIIILASIFALRVLMTFILEWEIKQGKAHHSSKTTE